jgi:hypothetical protein
MSLGFFDPYKKTPTCNGRIDLTKQSHTERRLKKKIKKGAGGVEGSLAA